MLTEAQLVKFDSIKVKQAFALRPGGPPHMKIADTTAVLLDDSATVEVSVDPGTLVVSLLGAKVVY
jgi:hypothetical protein